jgi:hypothetical protein
LGRGEGKGKYTRNTQLGDRKNEHGLYGVCFGNACSRCRGGHKRIPGEWSEDLKGEGKGEGEVDGVRTQRKKSIVTRHRGYIDCLTVNSAALVRSLSLTRRDLLFRKAIFSRFQRSIINGADRSAFCENKGRSVFKF